MRNSCLLYITIGTVCTFRRLSASTLENGTKDGTTRDRATNGTPHVVDNIAGAVTASIKHDVHGGAQAVVARVTDNVDVCGDLDLDLVDAVGGEEAAVSALLVELLNGVHVRLLDAVAVAVRVLGLDFQLVRRVGAGGFRVAPVAGELDVEAALAGDVLAEILKGLVELVPEELHGIVLLGVTLFVVALAAVVGVPERPDPVLGAVAGVGVRVGGDEGEGAEAAGGEREDRGSELHDGSRWLAWR